MFIVYHKYTFMMGGGEVSHWKISLKSTRKRQASSVKFLQRIHEWYNQFGKIMSSRFNDVVRFLSTFYLYVRSSWKTIWEVWKKFSILCSLFYVFDEYGYNDKLWFSTVISHIRVFMGRVVSWAFVFSLKLTPTWY